MGNLINAAKPFQDFMGKAEQYLTNTYPDMLNSGAINAISVGRNTDSAPGDRGGYRVRGNVATMASALFVDLPGRILDAAKIANEDAKRKTFESRASDAIRQHAVAQVNALMEQGADKQEAQARVSDSMSRFGYFDVKKGVFVTEPIKNRVNDSVLSGLATPYWDISPIQKVFKQPFVRGYAEALVSQIGVPNVWADLIQLFTESFEGFPRISNVGRTNTEMNTSIAVKNRTGTMLSEIINLVIDYEAPSPGESIVGGMAGNWLTNAVIGDRDAYGNLMLEQLKNMLIYFGNAEAGFDGLAQIATRDGTYDYYPDDRPPASYLWDNDGAGGGAGPVNNTVGADLLLMFNHLIADKMEELYFLPVDVKVTCSPILYKALKFSMLSKVYNQNSPLTIIDNAFESGNKIVGTMATNSGDNLYRKFELVPDPMLNPGTPFNDTDEDLMYITFPTFQSALDPSGLSDLVMLPTPIDKMILPSAPGFRDGIVRTSIKRIGSILAPVEKTVHVISGMGTNSRYTPPTP